MSYVLRDWMHSEIVVYHMVTAEHAFYQFVNCSNVIYSGGVFAPNYHRNYHNAVKLGHAVEVHFL